MKKILLLLISVALFSFNSGKAQPFEVGSNVINAGIGLGWSYSYFGSSTSLPALNFSYEMGITEIENIGILSVGGIMGFKRTVYRYPAFPPYNDDKASWTVFFLGGKGAIHLDLFNNEALDTYGGVIMGIRSVVYNNTYYEAVGGDPYDYGGIAPLFSGFVGTRYFFTESIAIYGELGYGVSLFTLGLSMKF